ncbi:hypothetical protein [Flavobacterium humidisoli]|uniref:WG containing repeat-containing protein n=1 Tax=Flavobacterium humidisoli TaxID=2937442 RepID=A0ABY4LP20_9FLAO|nr:hypothetical protein [Flavobacterium humidisoli]UPZ14832.1 hypothetical protein M0M44_18970 [Flavobacterium humidisoli]
MKFALKNKINDLDTFLLTDSSELIYIKENVLYNKGQNSIYDAKNEISGLKSSGEWICFNHTLESPKGFIGKYNDFQVFDKQIFKAIEKDCAYYGDRFSTTKLHLGETFTKVWNVEERLMVFMANNGFLVYTKDGININFCLDDSNLQLIWKYGLAAKYSWKQSADCIDGPSVKKQAEVIKFLGIYQTELWLVLNSGAILALDIKAGVESRHIKEGKMIKGESDFEGFKGCFGYHTVLDEKNGLIFNLSRHFYIEFDLNSNAEYFSSYSFKGSSLTHKLKLNCIGGFDMENIYGYEGSDNNRFAVFSRQQKEIIWNSEIEEAKGKFPAIRDLKYGGGKIYVLDHHNSLHIFQKD